MKLRSFFSILAGAVLVLFLVGVAGAYWLTATSAPTLQRQATQPTTTIFVSRQAPAVATLLANPDRLEASWLATVTPANRRSLQTQWHRSWQSLFTNLGLDYDRDLKAWLADEMTIALTTPDIDRNTADGLQPGYLLALTIAKPELAQTAVQEFWQRKAAAKDLVFEQFAGVQLIHAATQPTKAEIAVTSAVVGDRYVLFANSPKVMRDALNNVQVPELSLDRSYTYQQALEQFSEPLALVAINFSQLSSEAVASVASLSVAPLSKAGVKPDSEFNLSNSDLSNLDLSNSEGAIAASSYAGLIAAFKPNSQGLFADTLLIATDPGTQPVVRSTLTKAEPLLKFIPAVSRLAVASEDLQQTWQQWRGGSNPIGASLQQPLTALEQKWGIRISETIFPWVTGKYVLAQLPHTGQTNPDWLFVTDRSPQTEAGIEQLDQIVRDQGGSIGSFLLDDRKIYAWTQLKVAAANQRKTALTAEVQGVHTTVGNYEILATSLEAIEQALAAETATADAEVQVAIGQLPSPSQGYLYFDQEKLSRFLQSIRSAQSLQSLASWFRSGAISSYSTSELGLRGAVFLRWKDL